MCVDKTRHAKLTAEIDDVGSTLWVQAVPKLIDFFSQDADGHILVRCIALAIVKRAAADIRDLRRCCRLGLTHSEGSSDQQEDD